MLKMQLESGTGNEYHVHIVKQRNKRVFDRDTKLEQGKENLVTTYNKLSDILKDNSFKIGYFVAGFFCKKMKYILIFECMFGKM